MNLLNGFMGKVSHATNALERDQIQPWQVTDAPEQFVDYQLLGIVGLEVLVAYMQGKWKMGQNKNAHDVEGVKLGLTDAEDPHQNVTLARRLSLALAVPRASILKKKITAFQVTFLDVSFDTTG